MPARLFSFPDYESPTGKAIKAHLKREWAVHKLTDMKHELTDALVYQALQLTNRMEHAQAIAEYLAGGDNVVADRYIQSGMVYGAADGLDPDYLETIHRWLPQPNLSLLIDIDPEQSIERRPEQRDRYESQAGLMETVAKGYRELWKDRADCGWPYIVIDGRGMIAEVAEQIDEAIRMSNES